MNSTKNQLGNILFTHIRIRYFWRERLGAPGCALNRNCCIILEKGDLFWSTTSVEVRRSWHFISRHVRSLLLRRRCRSAAGLRYGLDYLSLRRTEIGGAEQSVGRAAWCATFVCGGLRSRPSCPSPVASAGASETTNCWCEWHARERDRAMAVSQPRPPDRVDAALEKVAPLRYLKAHECARAERVVTLYYHKPLSNNSFLSCKRRFQRNFGVFNVLPPDILRYVQFCNFYEVACSESLSLA